MDNEYNDEPTKEEFERLERDEYYNNRGRGCLGIVIVFIVVGICSLCSCNHKSKYEQAVEDSNAKYDPQIDSLTNVTDSVIATR